MTDRILRFVVNGKPQTAGSKRPIAGKRKDGSTFARAIEGDTAEALERKRTWRQDIQAAAREAMAEAGWEKQTGPLMLELYFLRERPKSHYGYGRNSHLVKRSAPREPTGRPDCLKLARAAEDAMTGVVWADDAQIVDGRQRKLWVDAQARPSVLAPSECMAVTVRRMTL